MFEFHSVCQNLRSSAIYHFDLIFSSNSSTPTSLYTFTYMFGWTTLEIVIEVIFLRGKMNPEKKWLTEVLTNTMMNIWQSWRIWIDLTFLRGFFQEKRDCDSTADNKFLTWVHTISYTFLETTHNWIELMQIHIYGLIGKRFMHTIQVLLVQVPFCSPLIIKMADS